MSSLSFHAFHAPKEGNTEAEYEDALSITDGPALRIAVADGASSSVFARDWANLLVRGCASTHFEPEKVNAQIAALGSLWRQQVSSESLPWYTQEKLHEGSHAALLVVEWSREPGVWSAWAVGDTCLFLVRQEKLERRFPVDRAADFGNSPPLVSTEAGGVPEFQTATGKYLPGDRFYLMTDALAAWLLREIEMGKRAWRDLPDDEDSFRVWLTEQRENGGMRNDDVTMLEITAGQV